jgi:hypothetical protein
MVVVCHRQDQTSQLEDTWPVGCSCIHTYQLATQLDGQIRQLLPSILCIPVCCAQQNQNFGIVDLVEPNLGARDRSKDLRRTLICISHQE